VLSCLNAPELDTNFIKDIFSTYANEFKFEKRLENLSTFPAINDEKALKNLIFIKEK
jgi:23S rRNA (cytosine1962-C5)-methyltransferase